MLLAEWAGELVRNREIHRGKSKKLCDSRGNDRGAECTEERREKKYAIAEC
jgi:hypothetical protein